MLVPKIKIVFIPFLIILFFQSFPNKVLSQETEKFIITPVYKVGSSEDQNKIFGKGLSSVITTKGILFHADRDAGEIRAFDKGGDFLFKFGSKGKGPGEFEGLKSIGVDAHENILYAFDYKNSRVTMYDLRVKKLIKSFVLDMDISFLNKMVIYSDSLIGIVGQRGNQDELIHFFNNKGKYLYSMARLLDIDNPKYDSPVIKRQLNQGSFCRITNGDIIVILSAPYILARYSINKEIKWRLTDKLLPKPWTKYIKFTADRYVLKSYPMVTSVYSVNNNFFVTTIYGLENVKVILDLRKTEDGTIIFRQEMDDYGIVTDFKAITDNQGYIVIKETEKNDLKIYSWKLPYHNHN